MQQKIVDIKTISELHSFYGLASPLHPLISIIDLRKIEKDKLRKDIFEHAYRMNFYAVLCKKYEGTLKYGQTHYDFNEGSLMFLAPHQLVAPTTENNVESGWGLFFHPDILNTTTIGSKINGYTFFDYTVNEALHVSDEEKVILATCLHNIEREYAQNIDVYTNHLIQSNIQLLLDYCERFYSRQFFLRAKSSKDIVQRFEQTLKTWFQQEALSEVGIPEVKHLAAELCLSPNYLTDLLKKYTGKTTQEHIHLQLLEKAKMMLWSSDRSVAEIAFALGFEHPSHFNKIFKSKVGMSPKQFRMG